MDTRTLMIKGAGEKASAVAHRLFRHGFRKILMTEKASPIAERRTVSFCEALSMGRHTVEGVAAERCEPTVEDISRVWRAETIAVATDPETALLSMIRPHCFIDAVMAKRNTGTRLDCAPLVIALGPGFRAGVDAHRVIETNPHSPRLGAIITRGCADDHTGIPTAVAGLDLGRLLRAPVDGTVHVHKDIGSRVRKGDVIAEVGGVPIHAPVSGAVWGIVAEGVRVKTGQKIGDVDPRAESGCCMKITPQAHAIAEGVLEAVLAAAPPRSDTVEHRLPHSPGERPG